MERPPQLPDEPIEPTPEHKSISYEEAFEAARTLRAAGIENPLNGEYDDEAAQSAWDKIQVWAQERNLPMAGGYTAQKATDRVFRETMFVTAGYTEPDVLRAFRDDLIVELAAATNEDSEEGAKILREALDDMQAKLEAADPNEKISIAIETKFREADALFAEGRFIRAVGAIYGALMNKQFADVITDEQRQRYLELMNEASRQAGLPIDENFTGFPKNWRPKSPKK